MIRVCPYCTTKNRIPVRYLASQGKCGNCKQRLPPQSEPIDVSLAEFDAIVRESPVPILVDFWASWCGPCRMAAPEVAKVAYAFSGRALVLKVNSEQEQELSVRYQIRSIPNFLIFKDGQLQWQQAGFMNQSQLEEVLSQWV